MSGRSHLIASGLMGTLVGTLAAIPVLNVSFSCCCLPLVVGVAGAIFMTLKTNDNAPMSNNQAMAIGLLTAIVATMVYFFVGTGLQLLTIALIPEYQEIFAQPEFQARLIEKIGITGGIFFFTIITQVVWAFIFGIILCVLSPLIGLATLNFVFPKRLEGAE